jgi:hypothetical protein
LVPTPLGGDCHQQFSDKVPKQEGAIRGTDPATAAAAGYLHEEQVLGLGGWRDAGREGIEGRSEGKVENKGTLCIILQHSMYEVFLNRLFQ